ncbi:hypothetical protein MCOR09_008928 [Pyricularia oryzae]|nr:hypothetical protein MCOR09_008928 [Pyricularia oryzae]
MAKIRMLLGWPLENLEVPVDDDDVGVVDRRALCLEQSCSCGAAVGPLLCNHHRNSQRRPHIPTEAPPMTPEPLDRSGAASASRPSGNRLLPIPPSTGRGLVDSMPGNLGRAVKRSPDRRSQKSLFMRSAQPVTLLSVTHMASPLRH